jgi:hypothetical protein
MPVSRKTQTRLGRIKASGRLLALENLRPRKARKRSDLHTPMQIMSITGKIMCLRDFLYQLVQVGQMTMKNPLQYKALGWEVTYCRTTTIPTFSTSVPKNGCVCSASMSFGMAIDPK